ncbi:aromatic amino acid ammonia-lyase [Streptomyces camelliae]|uniref:Aromatic amino acid lyase n=1 Tax=Streptomyces camelliae TaxID=3004093 RepID=A0ABY7P8I4_9ACTN|nr:aromatic amino acid ammonia-lyase [Streptomyces sp. HUAS 2-6]WBO65854.1 aromatic amino acid lyase [Streptomyces sp. HUAS 2-6]
MSSRVVAAPQSVPSPRAATVVLDGSGLGVEDVVRLADGTARPVPAAGALRRVEESWNAARRIAATGRVYGRSTGVGANRNVDVPAEAVAGHGLRLLRSHAGAIGEELPARQVRATLAVRANQLLAGGAGLRPGVVTALCEALETGAHPAVNEFGSVGTGDIAALAQVGLALAGEHPWHGPGAPAPLPLDNNDALALISSNALTLGQSALALDELRGLIGATQVVAALSLLAVDGSHEAYAAPVHAARPHRGSVEVARRMRELIGAADRPTPPPGPLCRVRPASGDGASRVTPARSEREAPGRIQDPYGFRCLPQIHGPALDAADALEQILTVEMNAAAENPLIAPEDLAAYHHGGFYAAQLALALDHFRLALMQVARLSTSRLSTLNEPAYTRLRPFLADHEPASSGVMILEYAAGAALGELRAFSAPASLGHAVLSRGVEEQASFASLAARQTLRACGAYRLVAGCELVAAVRALRQRDLRPDPGLPAGRAFALAESVLDPDPADRPLTKDVTEAAALLDRFTDIWRGSAS